MKISASLPEADVLFVDEYAAEHANSRSGVIHEAIALLRQRNLGDQYEAAWEQSRLDDPAQVWDAVVGDGLA